MDLIQARYGWTDDVVFGLPYPRFSQLTKQIIDVREQDILDNYSYHAFQAWLMGAGKKKQKFGDYLKSLGLTKKKSQQEKQHSKEEVKHTAEQNKQNAQRILLLDKRNREKKSKQEG